MTSQNIPRDLFPADRSPRFLYFLAFILRVGLGLSLLNHGLLGYIFQSQMGGGVGGNPYTQAYAQMLNIGPGTEPFHQVLPYAQIAVGMALILGFMTTPAAVAAGIVILLTPLMQTIALLLNGAMVNRNMMMGMSMQSVMTSGEMSSLLLAAIVVWLSPVRTNPWSLDGLMFRRGRRRAAESLAGVPSNPPKSSWTGQAGVPRMQGDPAATFHADLVSEFNPDAATTPQGPA
jgi:uncharacterized membrane protein YphA (DoxX/SURF4 family)